MRFALSTFLVLALLALFCGMGYAADSAPLVAATTPIPADAPWWASIVYLLLTTIVTMFLVPFLKQKATAAKSEADATKIDASKSLIEQRGILADRLKSYLWGSAAAIAEDRFPKLAMRILKGEFKDASSIKTELGSWGIELRQQAIVYFQVQGIDLIKEFGVSALDDLIERAANAVSPFPGKDTAVTLLETNVAPTIISHGTTWVQAQIAKYGTLTPVVPVGVPTADAPASAPTVPPAPPVVGTLSA